VFRIDTDILFFFKAQIEANSLRLFAKFETQKKSNIASQNVQVISLQCLSIIYNLMLYFIKLEYW